MFLKSCGVIVMAGVLASCAGIEHLDANRLSKSTKKSDEVELAHWAYWDDNCAGEEFSVAILQPPAHGTTEVRESVFAIPERTSSGASTGCVDQIVESKKVFYIPNGTYVGDDTALVEFSGSTGSVKNLYTITVR